MTTMTNASVREFKMPDVGEGLTEAEILKWYVQPGDTVTDGQVVCEVETAKAAVELPIPYDGVVRELHFPEGTTVDVGTSIIAVDVAGGAAPVVEEEAPAPASAPVAEPEEEKPAARQPVLVGYGVATSSTRRRPRRTTAPDTAVQPELNGRAAPPPPPRRPRPPPPRGGGGRIRRPSRPTAPPPSPRSARWRSPRCASWRRTWASI